jgi:hypothetical protein
MYRCPEIIGGTARPATTDAFYSTAGAIISPDLFLLNFVTIIPVKNMVKVPTTMIMFLCRPDFRKAYSTGI